MLGVVAVKPPHIMAAGEADDAVPIRDLWLDVGLTQEQAEKAAPVGTPIVYREETFRLGEDLIAGKSLDDRSCFAILLRTLELLKGEELDVDVAVAGQRPGGGHRTQLRPLDGLSAEKSGGGGAYSLESGGHGGQYRHQRLGYAGGPGGGSAQLLAAFLRRVGKEDALCWRN